MYGVAAHFNFALVEFSIHVFLPTEKLVYLQRAHTISARARGCISRAIYFQNFPAKRGFLSSFARVFFLFFPSSFLVDV